MHTKEVLSLDTVTYFEIYFVHDIRIDFIMSDTTVLFCCTIIAICCGRYILIKVFILFPFFLSLFLSLLLTEAFEEGISTNNSHPVQKINY